MLTYDEKVLQLEEKPENDIFQKTIRQYRNDDSQDNDNSPRLFSESCYHSLKYYQAFRRSIDNPEDFWSEEAKKITWFKPWTKVLDNTNPPFTKWFVGAELNACYNCLDRHVLAGIGEKTALIHDSPVTGKSRSITYKELLDQVSRLAGALATCGVVKGDRVLIYMPLVPEAMMSMLACARLGAIHTVVFGGFAARELCSRIDHAEPKVIIAASCGIEPNKIIRYKEIVNEAIRNAKVKPSKCIIFQRKEVQVAELDPKMDWAWDDAIASSQPHECVSLDSNDPLYILYTSGTTAKPKGILRTIGGHMVALSWSMSAVYDVSHEDVWWTASDMGWVLGHSYICYGPLLHGCTSVMHEGKPDRTPDAGQYYRVISKHGVNAMFTAPTALRIIRREDPEAKIGHQYSTKSLKIIYVAGEHCDQETRLWAEKMFNVPVLNHWWQSESGHPITANCIGLGHSTSPPKYSAGMSIPGYDLRILRKDGSEADCREEGRVAIKLPLPPGNLSNLYLSPERFKSTYFNTFPGYYDTMDEGFIDEFGYVYILARSDDVINVAGHRLSTSALEEVILSHPDICEGCVFGAPESSKGDIPFCIFVINKNAIKSECEIRDDLVEMVRKMIGPIAGFHEAAAVPAIPRTRSGKTPRKSFSDIAKGKKIQISPTIEDPLAYKGIIEALNRFGYAKNIGNIF